MQWKEKDTWKSVAASFAHIYAYVCELFLFSLDED